MRPRSSRRLAGCCAIELLFAAGLWAAAASDYRAGTAATRAVRALAIEDARGNRAVLAQAGFRVTLEVSDLAAAQLMQAYGLERGAILLRGVGRAGSPPNPRDSSPPPIAPAAAELVTAAAAALGKLDTVRLTTDRASLAVFDKEGRCLAALRHDATLSFEPGACAKGQPVRAPIRAVFRTVDLTALTRRAATLRTYPVQALAFGKEFAILALAGDAPIAEFQSRSLVVLPNSNNDAPFPDDPRVRDAIRQSLSRIGR